MLFNSFQFLWLFPIIFLIYYLVDWVIRVFFDSKKSSKIGNFLLIIISYALYLQWNAKYVFILLGITTITYFGAIIIEKNENKKKFLVVILSSLALLPLIIFKYTNFICENIEYIVGGGNLIEKKLIAPIGISFYTFQALGYLLDVYNERIKSEKNWWNYTLFVCFFPQILSGPISKAGDLLPQIKADRNFNYEFAVRGLRWLLWGMFLKVVVADRLSMYVDTVLNDYNDYSGTSILVASIFYSLQIYGDFAGYSLMAIGVAKLMGFSLVNNFNRPYFATSITDFWKRWHISLTKWLTTHVYIALGGNRCSKPKQYSNILITFIVSGIWHGANWTFILWGLVHGIIQVIEKAVGFQKFSSGSRIKKSIRIAITFSIVNFAWLIFRMPTIIDALNCVLSIFTNPGELYLPEIDILAFLIIALLILFLKDFLSEFYPSFIEKIMNFKTIRWSLYFFITLLVTILGVFNSESFIYLQF